jgi:8-oxo-dGTP diphosphatase
MTDQDRRLVSEAMVAGWDDHAAVREALKKLEGTEEPALLAVQDLYRRRLQELALSVRDKYVLGFAFYKTCPGPDRVVLIRKVRPVWQAGCLNGVGGKVNAGETQLDAMAREFQQEAGVWVEPTRWSYFATLAWAKASVDCYTVDLKENETACTRTDEEVVTLPVGDALAHATGLVMGCRWLIPLALDKTAQPVTVKLR